MRHEKVVSLLARNIWGLFTKPFNASPGTRSTAKHMIQRAKKSPVPYISCSQEITAETKDLLIFT